jgi:hypothetical protein
MIKYLIVYLVVGALVIGIHQALRWFTNYFNSEPGILDEAIRNHNTWMETWLAPVVELTFLLLAWPLLCVSLINNKFFPAKPINYQDPEPFAVCQADLIEQIPIVDIEKQNMVDDPLGAVPQLPFGHLHSAWQNFTELVGHDGVIWRFSADYEYEMGHYSLYNGYVIVRPEGIGQYFPTSIGFRKIN